MKKFSIYEARAKFSEVVREVLSSGGVVITQRGEPVIRLIPFRSETFSLADRISSLEQVGRIRRASGSWKKLPKVKAKAGAVRRFLEDRGE